MIQKKAPRDREPATTLPKPKTTDDWQDMQDLQAVPEVVEDNLDALAGDEPPRILSKTLERAEKLPAEPA